MTEYRTLKAGDVLQARDELKACGEWDSIPQYLIGNDLHGAYSFEYRRPIKEVENA